MLWMIQLTNYGLSCSSTLFPFTHFDSSPNQNNPSHPTQHHSLTVLKHYFTQILQNQTSWCPKSTSKDLHNVNYHLIILSVYPHIYTYFQLHVYDMCVCKQCICVHYNLYSRGASLIDTCKAIWKVSTSFGLPPFWKQLLSYSKFKIYLL